MWEEEVGGKEKGSEKDRERRERRSIEKAGTQKVLEMEKGLWEKGVGKDASAKGLGSRDRTKRGVYTKEREGVFIVKRRKGGGTSICGRSTAKRVYPTLQVAANFTSALCSKKGQQKKDSTRLPPYKPMDGKE